MKKKQVIQFNPDEIREMIKTQYNLKDNERISNIAMQYDYSTPGASSVQSLEFTLEQDEENK